MLNNGYSLINYENPKELILQDESKVYIVYKDKKKLQVFDLDDKKLVYRMVGIVLGNRHEEDYIEIFHSESFKDFIEEEIEEALNERNR